MLVVVAFSGPVGASWDLEFSAVGRTYPWGGTLNVNSGYGLLLWGENKPESAFYGFIRPSLGASTAASYNSGHVQLDVNPISFWSFYGGLERAKNTQDYRDFDCQLYRCQGSFSKAYWGSRIILGYDRLFTLLRFQVESHTQSGVRDRQFIDPGSGLSADQQGDTLQSLTGILGYRLSEKWAVMALSQHFAMREARGTGRMHLLNMRYSIFPQLQLFVGGGVFESSLKPAAATGVLRLVWTPKKSMGY